METVGWFFGLMLLVAALLGGGFLGIWIAQSGFRQSENTASQRLDTFVEIAEKANVDPV